MTFRRGLKPSTPSKTRHRLGATQHPCIAGALAAGLRGSADLSGKLPRRFDQGQTETCFAHSLGAGVYCVLGAAIGFVPSPALIASTTYADVRSNATPVGALPVLVDTGAELQDAATALARWGVCPIGAEADGRYSDVPDDQDGVPFAEPVVSELQFAGAHLLGGEYSVTIDSTAPSVIAASLDAGIPVWVGGPVGQAYEALGPSDIAEPTPADDPSAAGHAQLIVGYRTNAVGALEFLVVNSWGTSWGLDGTVWASSAWVEALWEAWPLTVKS